MELEDPLCVCVHGTLVGYQCIVHKHQNPFNACTTSPDQTIVNQFKFIYGENLKLHMIY